MDDDERLAALGCSVVVGCSMVVAALSVALGAAWGWHVGVAAWLAIHGAMLVALAARGGE